MKKGNSDRINKKLTFSCENCGCIFTACNTDYKFQCNQYGNESWYEIKCPYCRQYVTLNDDDAEKQWQGVNKEEEHRGEEK